MVSLRKTQQSEYVADMWIQDGYLYLQTQAADRMFVQMIMKGHTYGAYDPSILTWQLPANHNVAENVIHDLGGRVRVHESVRDLIEQGSVIKSANTLKSMDAEEFPEICGLLGTSWAHQRQAYAYMIDTLGLNTHGKTTVGSHGVGLFADMGTGKTRATLGIVASKKDVIKRTLVICPKRVIQTWVDEVKIHIEKNHRPNVYPLLGSIKERADFVLSTKDQPGLFVVNYDATVYPAFANALLKCKWDMIILDEAHKIKAAGGVTSKFIARLGAKAQFRIAQTGTPNSDKPLDVYGTYRFLNPTIFGSSYNRFRDQYAEMGGYMNREIVRYKNLENLSDKMYTVAFRVTDKVLKLPPVMEHQIKVQLGPRAQAAYDKMHKDMVVAIGDGSATVQNSLTKILRLQQITSGYLPVDYFEEDTETPVRTEIEEFEQDKKDALAGIVDDMPEKEPLVVFCKYIYDLESVKKVAKEFGRRYLELSGRRDDLADFKSSNDNCILGVQITAGGAGVDLTRSIYCVYYSLTHSLTSFDQSFKRQNRPGQRDIVHYYYLTVPKSIDTAILAALKDKKNVAKYVLDEVQAGKNPFDYSLPVAVDTAY